MKAFFDSSALAKRYIAERGSDDVDAICLKADRLGICMICVPEIISAMNRRVRERAVSRSDYQRVKAQLLQDVRDMEIVNVNEEVVAEAIALLESNTLRAMDGLHLSAAKAWGCDLFVTSDKVQAAAARKSGLKHIRV